MKPWYRIIDCASPNKLYNVLDVRIHAGAGKGFPSVIVRVVNGQIIRVKPFGFRSIHTAADIAWVVESQEAFYKWLEVISPIKKMFTLEELEKYLMENGFERRN